MDKASRIERTGKALQSIATALESKDLSELPADVLLKLQLKYEEQLRAEYSEPTEDINAEKLSIDTIIANLSSLYKKQTSGEITPAQAKAQLATLTSLLSAHNRKEAGAWFSL